MAGAQAEYREGDPEEDGEAQTTKTSSPHKEDVLELDYGGDEDEDESSGILMSEDDNVFITLWATKPGSFTPPGDGDERSTPASPAGLMQTCKWKSRISPGLLS